MNKNPLAINKVNEKLQKLHSLCFPKVSERQKNSKPHKLSKLLHLLLDITYNSEEIQLKYLGPHQILPSSIKILSICDENMYKSFKPFKLEPTKSYKTSKNCYYDLLSIFTPEKSQEIIKTIIRTINQENLWQFQNCCHDLIIGVLKFNGNEANVIYYLLKIAESKLVNHEDARAIIYILTEVFQEHSWFNEEKMILIISRLLNFYRNGIIAGTNTRNKILKDALEVFIRSIIDKLINNHLLLIIYKMCCWMLEKNSSDKFIWELGKIVEHAAYIYETNLLEETLTEKILNIFMQMISSSNSLISLLGNRVFQHLIDRNKNKRHFESPEIFFEGVKYDIKYHQNDQRDLEFLKLNRELIHDTLVESIMKHSSEKLNLESTYCTICLLVVEVPFGFTAAAVVCLVMNIQKLTLENSIITREVSYHIHATIMAVSTLICWIHDAKVFYAYVNKIMMKRAQWAPQLNPPLKTHYVFAVHYVRWNKPELFFINWEARFGLWKCFRSLDDKNKNENIIS